MEEQILTLLKEDNRPFDLFELNDALGLKTVNEMQELIKVLNKMERDLKIRRTKKDKYLEFTNDNSKIKKGIIDVTKKGYGFVSVDDGVDIFIPAIYINGAINKDEVAIEVTGKSKEAPEGKVLYTISRNLQPQVGEVYHEKNKCLVKLDDSKLKLVIELNDSQSQNLVDGHKVLLKLTDKLKDNHYKCEIIDVIGHKAEPQVDILSITESFGCFPTFDDDVISEVNALPSKVLESDFKNRKDLRDEMIFTIDGDDTKDIDDAISIKKLTNGYELGVHIADVSYYVKPNSKIDNEAYNRSTSVYPPGCVIPMLPQKLSNGICSLNPDVDRLAISCVMQIDESGNITDYDIFESVIKSKKQMTYNNVNKIFNNEEVPAGYQEFVKPLKEMQDLANILRNNKIKRGYIDFDLDESKILLDEKGKPYEITLRERGIGERLIEDFMIAANETVATHIYNMDLPFIYRVHGEVNEKKLDEFIRLTALLGYNINLKNNNLAPKDIQNIIDQFKDKDEAKILSNMLLRCMQKAVYSENNIGHFGLASNCYTHFTSPIRRYPDTTVHRLLRTYLFNKDYSKETIDYWHQTMPSIAIQTSERERNADECEREVCDMKMAEYMESHIDEEYEGVINTVVNFGMFVELSNMIEGLVKKDSLPGHYYYDEATFSFKSSTDKRGYRLGDKVRVKVVAASKEERTIDFTIIESLAKEDKVLVKER